jgi:hypothetical protein
MGGDDDDGRKTKFSDVLSDCSNAEDAAADTSSMKENWDHVKIGKFKDLARVKFDRCYRFKNCFKLINFFL